MKQCWLDGDLRAFADGELPSESRQQIAGHLEICPACRERYREISERAARVYYLMAGLTEAVATVPTRRAGPRRHWRLAALPLAAALAIGIVGLPKRGSKVPPPAMAATEGFVRLDDEHFETGVIVRVAAENGDMQADLILGPDGRAHAIRMVSNR